MGLRTMLTKHPKTNVYYFRKRIPQELVDLIGKKEISKSLGTKDAKEAKRLVVEAEAEYNEFLESQRANIHVPLQERQKIVADLISTGLLSPETKDITPDVIFQLSERVSIMLDTYMQEGAKRKLEHKSGTADNDPAVHMLDDVIQRCVMLAKKLRLYEHMYRERGFLPSSYLTARNNNKLVVPDVPHNQIENIIRLDVPSQPITISTPPPASNVTPPNSMRLSKALKEWSEEKERRKNTLQEWQTAVKWFIELYSDCSVTQITRSHAREYKEALKIVPKTNSLPKNIANKNFAELFQIAKERTLESYHHRDMKTNNKYLRAMSSIINLAIKENDLSVANPFSNMLFEEGESDRVPYTDEDLQTIFSSPLYTMTDTPRNELFWLPMIALYTGARPSELGQLLLSDIKKKHDIWCFDINNAGRRKQLKTASAKREIPIHSEIIKCGLLQYIEALKAEGHQQLFPNFDLTLGSGCTKEFSRQYSRYCDKIAAGTTIKETGKTFYSLRHRFADMLREAEIPYEAKKRLMGHAFNKGDMDGVYGDGTSMKKKKEYIESIQYPFLDFSALHGSEAKTDGKKKKIRLVKKG